MALYNDSRFSNLYGALTPDVQERLRRVLDHPARYWGDAHSIILRSDVGLGLTLWQAVRAVDPTFPNVGPTRDRYGRLVRDWARIPDQMLIARALKYAATRPCRKAQAS